MIKTKPYIDIIKRDIKLFISNPKAYLYSFTFPKDEYVHVLPFNPQIYKHGKNLVKKIRAKHPKLKVHFVGSAALKIDGHKDIDLLAECDPQHFDAYIPALVEILGSSYKRRPQFVEWHTRYRGCDVQLMLIDPKHRTFRDLMAVYNLFKSNRKILLKYKSIKKECQGKSLREYKRRRMEFFNQTLNSIY